jgi:hypothetical protein
MMRRNTSLLIQLRDRLRGGFLSRLQLAGSLARRVAKGR